MGANRMEREIEQLRKMTGEQRLKISLALTS